VYHRLSGGPFETSGSDERSVGCIPVLKGGELAEDVEEESEYL